MRHVADVYETYYAADWGSHQAARTARNERRSRVVLDNGPSCVVRGRVVHPSYGEGYDLFYRWSGSVTRDSRIRPGQVQEEQRPPTLIETEEYAR